MPSLILALLPSVPLLAMAAVAAVQEGSSPALPDAAKVLAKLDADAGAPAARTKAKHLVVRGTVTAAGMPGEGKFEEIYAGPDKVRWNASMAGMGEGTQGTTGAFTWSTDPAMGVTIRDGDEQGPVVRQYGIARRADWKSMYARAETVGKTKLDDREVLELRMFPAKGDPETWFVDAETSRLVRVDQKLPDPLGGWIAVQTWFSDWKEVGGVKYAHTRKLKVGEYEIVFRTDSIEHPAAIAAERVAPPKEVLEARADPAKRTKEAPQEAGECVKTTVAAQPVASVRVKIPEKEIAQNLAVILPEVMAHLGSVGADMAGPPFSRYHELSGGMVDIEAGIPLKKKVEGKGRIQASELPAGEAAVTWHVGPYHELPKTYALLEAWMKGQGLVPGGGFWEVYWTDPGIEPDPKKWRTQILWPVKAGK